MTKDMLKEIINENGYYQITVSSLEHFIKTSNFLSKEEIKRYLDEKQDMIDSYDYIDSDEIYNILKEVLGDEFSINIESTINSDILITIRLQ